LPRSISSLGLLFTVAALSSACATTPQAAAGRQSGDIWVKVDGPVAAGDHPDFRLPRAGATGGERTLSELRGRVVVVDFWASWCAPCKEAMPFYAKLQADHQEALTGLGVNVDEEEAAFEAAMREAPPAFEVLRDASGKVVEAFGVETMPTSFILDREGEVVMVHHGFVPSDRDLLHQTIGNLLAR